MIVTWDPITEGEEWSLQAVGGDPYRSVQADSLYASVWADGHWEVGYAYPNGGFVEQGQEPTLEAAKTSAEAAWFAMLDGS